MLRWKLAVVLDIPAALAAAGAAGAWLAAAAVPLPEASDLTSYGPGWRPIGDALLDQSMWNRCGAACAAVTFSLHAVAIVADRVVRWGKPASERGAGEASVPRSST